MQRTVSLEEAGQLTFDYFVDSEESQDFFRVAIDGTPAFSDSGSRRAGRKTLPLAAGTHTVRFSYIKSTTGSAGQDTAWVDNVSIIQNGRTVERHHFNELSLGTPPGWQGGGNAGGWTVSAKAAPRGLRRSIDVAFLGYNLGGATAAVERTIVWPTTADRNTLRIAYTVDSEQDHDFLRVYVDGEEELAVSGPERSRTTTIDVGPGGPHTIRLAYEKDESVDEGLDDALVWSLEGRADGAPFEVLGLDGEAVGSSASGWTVPSDADAGWQIGQGVQTRVYVYPAVLASEPVIDGAFESAHRAGARVRIQESENYVAPFGQASVLVSASSSSLYLLGQLTGQDEPIGNESGEVNIFLDFDHGGTLAGAGCGPGGVQPGAEDRKIRVTYSSDSGQSQSTTSVEQFVGVCEDGVGSGWRGALASEALPFDIAVQENDSTDDAGTVVIELSVALPASALQDGYFGLGVTAATAPEVEYRLPGLDGAPPIDSDVSSWSSVRLGRAFQATIIPRNVIVETKRDP